MAKVEHDCPCDGDHGGWILLAVALAAAGMIAAFFGHISGKAAGYDAGRCDMLGGKVADGVCVQQLREVPHGP